MVETRRAKTTRLALNATVAQSNHSAFIRLPIEMKLMIYKYVWTPAVLPWQYAETAQREGQPVRDHMKQIHVLTSVCRRMRYEVIAEYFYRTQAHVLYIADYRSWDCQGDMRVLAAMRYLKSSRLFTEQLQHVRLNWVPAPGWTWTAWEAWYNLVDRGKFNAEEASYRFSIIADYNGGRQVDTLKWLASLKSLKTLETTFVDVISAGEEEEELPSFSDPVAWQKLRKLPKLEWVSVQLKSRHHKERKKAQGRLSKSGNRKKMGELVEGLLQNPSALLKGEHKPPRIDLHLGAVTAEMCK
ncbi:hypothetical protein QBC32DRAFT_222651 [Pseudoneurospora amorphoporcata]|uniref:Uncharacterized protein n=1 Tax=Pseudoneurospora amorphoporcata TaxID=241081 RepID=A0AAN6SCH8_9PEZI|nr:hypothetical protein QBC32DRAFT_222651 [Pseudoneurospora amorphoporcata]